MNAYYNTNNSLLNPIAARLVSIWFGGLSCLLAIGGTIWLVYTFWFVAHASKTQGRIVAMERRGTSKGHIMYAPVFAYDDTSGITHTQSCSMSSSDFSYEVGEKVNILYDSTRPIHSNIDSFSTLWLGPVVVIGISLLTGSFIGVWLVAFNSMMKRRQSQGAI